MKTFNLIKWLWTDSREKQSPQRFARYAAMLIMLLTLGVGQMWAADVQQNAIIYMDNSAAGWSYSNIYFVINNTNGYPMSAVANTKLYVHKRSAGTWGGYTNVRFFAATGSWGGDDASMGSESNMVSYGANLTNTQTNYGFNGNNYYVIKLDKTGTKTSSSTRANLSTSYIGNAVSSMNKTITVKAKVSTDGGSSYSEATSPGTLSASSNTFTAYNSCANSTSLSSGTISCGYTATTTLTAADATGYDFVGWYNSSGTQQTTSKTLTIYPTAAATYYAYYKEKQYSLTFSHNGHGTIAVGGSTVASGSTANVNYVSTKTLVATPSTGYNFSGWTKSGSNTGSVTIGNASNASTTIKATNTGATITAGFAAKTYTVTLDDNGSYQGNGSATATYNSSTLAFSSHAQRTDYRIDGYYAEAGLTTKVINADGSLVANVSNYTGAGGIWTRDANTTLYAKWVYDVTEYAVTYGVHSSGHGSLSAANTSTSAAISSGSNVRSGTGVTFTASPSTGYTVEGWYSNSGCTTPIAGAGTGSTYSTSISAATNVYVKFVEKTWSVAFAAGTGGTVTTPNSTPRTVGQLTGISIAATPSTGYTFNRWTISSGSGSFTSAVTTNSNKFKPTAASTITASFSETMSTLSTSCHYDVGNPSYAAPTVSGSATNVGYATTRTITATAAGTGYTFAGWTLTNCTRTDGGAPTATSITIRSNGDGAAATAQANYTEDLSSPWTIKGGTNITGNNWSTAYNMTKKSGHSTESVVYYTFNISSTNSGVSGSADDWSFKVIKDGSTWYGLYASGSYWWKRSTSANQSLTGEQNIQICADVAGPYEIKVDYTTPESPEVTVTFPTKYTVTYSVSPSGAANAITTSPSVASGGSVAAGTSMTFTHAAAKTGYSWYRWENGSGSSLGTGSTYTTTINANTTVVAKYTENTYNVTATASTGGSATPASATSMGQVTGGDITASPNTGYNFTNWTITSGSGYFGTSGTATTSTTANTKFRPTAAATIQANFTPKQTTITLNNQDATTPGSTEVTATFDAAMPAITLPEKTGYTFGGYWGAPGGSGPQYYNADGSSTQNWDNGNATYTLFAKWTPKTYTVTLDYDETNHGDITTTPPTGSVTATYDAAMPAIAILPKAAEGYGFMGYYSAAGGSGTQYYDGTGASVTNWNVDDEITLYAYYKKAEITAITLDATTVESEGTVSFAVTVAPTPAGTTKTCFTVLHSNDNPLAEQPTITYNGGTGKYSFTAPAASGTYKIETVLKTGSSCAGGTELDTEVANFQVAGLHTVTVRYKCGDEVIKAASSLEGIRPLDWSDEITAPDIIGYSFTGWSAGDGVSLTDDNGTTTKTSTTEADIKIKAIYDGYLTANYSKKRIIYFNNTLNWENVYVYFYKNGTYWNATNGTGCNGTYQYTDYPFSEGLYGQMLPVEEGSKIYYFDAEAAGVNASYQTVVFTELDQHTYDWFAKTGDVKNKVIKRDDYYSTKLPMYVPLAVQTPDSKNGNKADYYWQGYWMNYPENTGYTLKIYNQKATDGAVELKSIPFEFTADKTMPMELDVDLEAGKTYGFKIYRNDGLNTGAGSFYGNTGTMTANAEGWDMKTTASSNAGLQTTAAGSYKFVLNFYEISSDYQYRVSVTYPVAVGDYRIIYTDGATWSGSAHGASWNHPSGVIAKNSSATETKKDTVSFFWSYGSSPAIGYQTCSSLSAGSASWSAKTAISVSGYSSVLTKTGVYNFIFEQPAGGASISLVKVEPYTGNYYIRTDVANSKWDNYRTDPDHMMTYSDYSIEHGGYSHYYCHWVQTDDRKNMKFVIANDYSPCISDTLIRETASGEWANIATYIESNGDIKRNANVRYMWNQSTNKVSRAYIDGAQEERTYFLEILSDDDKIRDPDDHSDLNEISFNDIENWVYEQNIQAQPGAQIKLRSTWGAGTLIEQYFKGSSSATEQLIGGSDDTWYDIRILYDFKTNRLIASYIPVDENITTEKAIEADIMFIREHQGDIAQLTFGENGKISKIETAYGVMRFNKWTLNNLSKTYPHNPLSSPASIYERSLFYISFPFRVKLSDVIGFGTYGVHWAVQRYDGAARAQKGHFQENGSFWRWMNRNTEYLEPNQGYLLAIDLDLLGRYSDIWGPTDGGGLERRSERLEIYFPSYGTMPDITNASVTCSIPEHPCTINWYEEGKVPGPDTGDPRTSYNRTIFDSHWNVMSVPTYVNTNAIAFANTSWVTTFGGPNFLYTWNANDNTIAATSATGFEYHAMHSYMVQYGGNVTWTARSGSPAGIVASKTYAEQPSKVEFRLELQQDSAMIDRTFVALSNDEETSAGFRFGEDLTKEFNANKANIYTFIADEATAAGNTLPMSDQTTIVPVGVDIKTNGDYTFTIPDGTSGIGVTLIDTENNIRTSLSALSYTVNLTAGTHDGRFLLEIAPIQQTPTGMEEVTGDGLEVTGARKVIIDQKMYIIRDGKIYDARGARVQ